MRADPQGASARPHPAVFAIVVAYVTIVLMLPLLALAWGIASTDPVHSITSLVGPGELSALTNSFVLAALAVALNGAFGVAAALVIVRHRFVGRGLLDVLSELPLSISPVMTGLGFVLVFGRGGLLGPALEAIDLKVTFAFPGLLLATLFVSLPFTVREIANVLVELGTNEEEASTMLGGSAWQTFRLVTLPNIRAALGFGTMLTSARALGEFGAVLVVGGAISGRTHTATTYLYGVFEERDRAGAYGMALVLAVASLSLFALLSRRILKKV